MGDRASPRQPSDVVPNATTTRLGWGSGRRIAGDGRGDVAVIVIQARMGSTRLPGKVLRPLAGRSVLGWVVHAARASEAAERVVVATTTRPDDDVVVEEATASGAEVIRGDEDDVLSRFVKAVDQEDDATGVVRLTADCPLLDPTLVRACVRVFDALDVDYVSTISPRSLPRGLDVEVASAGALRRADREASGADRAHVTSYLYRELGRFRVAGLTFSPPADDLRVTMDTIEDVAAIEAIVEVLGDRPPLWREVVDLLRHRPDIAALNTEVRQKNLDEG